MTEYALKERWRLVRGNNLPPKLRHTLTVLMLFQGKNESAWFKRQTMADELGISVDVVGRKLAELEELGVVKNVWSNRKGTPLRVRSIDFKALENHQRTPTVESDCTPTAGSDCDGPKPAHTPTPESDSVRPYGLTHSDCTVGHEHTGNIQGNNSVEEVVRGTTAAASSGSRNDYPKHFETFWRAYPNVSRGKKKNAHREYRKAADRIVDAGTAGSLPKARQFLSQRAKAYAASWKGQNIGHHAENWLKDDRFDEPESSWEKRGGNVDDETLEVFASIRRTYQPDISNESDVKAILTPEQFEAAKTVGLKRIANSDQFDKATLAEYREARKAVA